MTEVVFGPPLPNEGQPNHPGVALSVRSLIHN
jgi:hypothetical protein